VRNAKSSGRTLNRTLDIDPLAPAEVLNEMLETARVWDEQDRAYYEQLRKEREEAEAQAKAEA